MKRLTIYCILLLLIGVAYSQTPKIELTLLNERLIEPSESINNRPNRIPSRSARIEQTGLVENNGSIGQLEEWANSDIPFSPSGTGVYAGDVNGDGKDDLVRQYRSVSDLSTSDISDFVNRTLIFFGGNNSSTPSQFVNSSLKPVGDLNNDTFDDALGENFDGTYNLFSGSQEGYLVGPSIDIPEELISSFASQDFLVFGFRDFDQDGFQDALLVSQVNDEVYFILYGAATLDQTEFIQYSKNSESLLISAFIGQDVVVEIRSINSLSLRADVLKLDNNRNIIIDQTVEPAYAETNFSFFRQDDIYAMDIDGNGNDEIFLGIPSGVILVYAISFEPSLSDNLIVLVQNNQGSDAFDLVPAGDLNGDQREDFINIEGNELLIAYGPSNISSGLSIDERVSLPADVTIRLTSDTRTSSSFGDFNDDGFDDLQLQLTQNTSFGQRNYFGGNTGVFTSQDILYSNDAYTRTASLVESTSLGDINGDGSDDIAILYRDRVEIFLGGTSSQSPNFTINSLDGFSEFTAGDFNGDDVSDLVIVEFVDNGQGNDLRAKIYYGSANFDSTVDQIITTDQIAPSVTFPFTLSSDNIGDINNDGKEDLIFYIPLIDDVFLYFGGDSFSASPDLVLNTAGNDFGISGLSTDALPFGARFQALGDMNGDGIDDFAFADIGRRYEPGNNFETKGSVFIYFGSSTPSFNEPDEILYLSNASANGFDLFGMNMAVGDFNGDNSNDLAVIPSTFQDVNSTNDPKDGSTGFFVYFGGASFDNQFDLNFSVADNSLDIDGITKAYKGNGELIGIPDIDNDGLDELYFSNSFLGTNYILLGKDFTNEVVDPSIRFLGPNQLIRMGRTNTQVNFLYGSAVGNFDSNDGLEIILPQIGDPNYRNDPLYSFPLSLSEILSLESPSEENYLVVYPNPVSDFMNFTFTDQSINRVQSISIYSLSGSLLKKNTFDSNSNTDLRLDIRDLPEGIYLIKAIVGDKVFERKVIID